MMSAKIVDGINVFTNIDQQAVGNIVIDGLHGILPHTSSALPTEMVMAHVVMLKAALMSMSEHSLIPDNAKSMLDYCWDHVLVEGMAQSYTERRIH